VKRDGRALARPDLVIGSSPQLFAAAAGLAVARHFGVPFVFEVRDLWPESLLAGGGRKGPGYLLLDAVARRLYRRADRILVLAQGAADYLAQRGIPAAKLIHVPNGVDVESVRPAAEHNGNRPFTLVYAGAHGPANGLDRVLDAAEILGDRSPVRFLLVGDGPFKDALRADARRRHLDNVEFRDAVGREELVSIFAHADAGLMLLRDAPLFSFAVSPNKLFDYLAAGLPVVCNVRGVVSRLLVVARAGVLASDSSGGALANAVLRLRDTDFARRREMGIAGRQWVERERSRQVLGQRLDRHLRELL
jgi:glycosyltransferase involved in cell wall biosynthesis